MWNGQRWIPPKYSVINPGGVWGRCYLVPEFGLPQAYLKDVKKRWDDQNGTDSTYFYVPCVGEYMQSSMNDTSFMEACERYIDTNLKPSGSCWEIDYRAEPGTNEDGTEMRMENLAEYIVDMKRPRYKRLFPVPERYFPPEENELGEVAL